MTEKKSSLKNNDINPIDFTKTQNCPTFREGKQLNEFYNTVKKFDRASNILQSKIDKIDKDFNLKINKNLRK